jgi:hypothetical protein
MSQHKSDDIGLIVTATVPYSLLNFVLLQKEMTLNRAVTVHVIVRVQQLRKTPRSHDFAT